MNRPHLTPEELREALEYEPTTGVFRWRHRGGRTKYWINKYVGRVAGYPGNDGYWRIEVNGGAYKAHRLAWFYVHGRWPLEQLDHINCVRNDNRLSNLREASSRQNKHNVSRLRSNKTGLKGAHFRKEENRWRSRIVVNGEVISLGSFETAQDAHTAYVAAARKYFGDFARFA